MNPLTKVKLINELNEREVQLGVAEKVSWHSEYKDSAWIFLGGLPYELTEGDIICVFSQYGEIVNINLVRDKKSGKSKGFCFLCYEDQRSTVLAVDNFNGIKIKGRTIRVDHVSNYRAPQESEDVDDVTRELQEKGCGANTPSSSSPEVSEDEDVRPTKKHKKDKKEKKKKKKEKEKTEHKVELPSCSLSSGSKTVKEKDDPGPKKHSSKTSEKAQKSESREGQKSESREGQKSESREGQKSESREGQKSESREGQKSESREGQKSESREGRKKHPVSPDMRSSFHGRAEDHKGDPKKEKPKHEHKSSSRKEGEEKNRDKERGRSSGTHSSRHGGHSEGRSHRSRSRSHRSRSRSHRSRSRSHRSRSRSHRSRSRSHRSRSRSPDKSYRHKKHRHSWERESFYASDRRHY